MPSHALNARPVARVSRAVSTMEGADMPVRRAFAAHGGVFADPFLMLDHFGPAPVTRDSRGFPPHPHRGFETVTYMLSGAIEHRDNYGGHAVIGPGDVQWMTAGAGIIHSETLPKDLRQQGGTVEGLQIWVNLPKADKAEPPHYQVLRADMLRDLSDTAPGVSGKLIAGELLGERGPAVTHSAMTVAVLRLDDEATLSLDLDPAMNVAVYVAAGGIAAGRGRNHVEPGQTAFFAPGDEPVVIAALADSLVLVMAGQPLNEPVVARGPFVMTTEGEVRQAMLDYQQGRFAGPEGVTQLEDEWP